MTPVTGPPVNLRDAPLPSLRRAEHLMVMPATLPPPWTAAQVRALPEEPGKHYEVIDGELFVSPGPSFPHQFVAGELFALLRAHVRARRTGAVLSGPAEIEPDEYTLVQPDLFVVPLVDGRPPRDWTEAGRVLLTIEVLSPTSSRRDRVHKRRLYQRMGVEYWLVDPDARVIERWLPSASRPDILDDRLEWRAEGDSDPLVLDIPAMFSAALGEDVSG